MKETVNANIGSLAFTLDEDAYRKLKEYLEAIGRHLPADDTDTLGDIERRIAEIFRERVSSPLRVITLAEVEEAMQRMGDPADFGSDRSGAEEGSAGPVGSAAEFVAALKRPPRTVILAHLSAENNRPALALQAMQDALANKEGSPLPNILVAAQDKIVGTELPEQPSVFADEK